MADLGATAATVAVAWAPPMCVPALPAVSPPVVWPRGLWSRATVRELRHPHCRHPHPRREHSVRDRDHPSHSCAANADPNSCTPDANPNSCAANPDTRPTNPNTDTGNGDGHDDHPQRDQGAVAVGTGRFRDPHRTRDTDLTQPERPNSRTAPPTSVDRYRSSPARPSDPSTFWAPVSTR